MRCIVVRREGRLVLRLNEKTLLEPPPGMRGVLAGALVEVESRYEAGRGLVVTRIDEVLAQGGGTPVAEARAYRERGLLTDALAALGELRDPAALATRARVKLDLGERADDELRVLLESGAGDATEPWDVASLFAALPEEARERLRPALGAWLGKTTLPPGSPAVQRVLEIAPPTAWTPEQLFARLARAGAGQREVLARAIEEARARGISDPSRTLAEETLAEVVRVADRKAAAKRAHVVLQAALRAARESARPEPPHHLGGPAPKLAISDLASVSTFCAERTIGLRAPGEPPVRELTPNADAYHALADAKAAAAAAVKALHRAKRHEDAAALLRDLDALLVEREWSALLEAHRDGAPEVARILWRGADESGRLAYVLVRTGDGGLALLAKTARRWRWHTGSPDDVLATVPDAHFEDASRRALAR